MTTIAVHVEDITNRSAVLACLRRITGLGFGEINQRLQANDRIIAYELYMNNHEEVARHLRRLIAEIPKAGGQLRVYKCVHDGTDNVLRKHEIPISVVRNMLSRADQELERQQDLDDVGHV